MLSPVTGVIPQIKALISRRLVANIYWLSLTQMASYVCPLLNVVFLTRALGPRAWGILATFQGFSAYFGLIVEYGFGLSATREVARHRDDRRALEKILASVFWAKLLLTGISAIFVACCFRFLPVLSNHPLLTVCATGLSLGAALTPVWFYQGIERIRLAAIIDVTGRIAGTVLTVLLVHRSPCIWIALVVPGLASFTSSAINHMRIYRSYRFVPPSPRLVWRALRFGWSMFIYRSSITLYTIGNTFVLALFVGPEYVGYYAAAERIARYSTALLSPVSQALYPRISYLVASDFSQAADLAMRSFRLIGALGLALGLLTFTAAPLVTAVFLGRTFGEAVPAIRILSLLPPVIALSNFSGFHWLLPLKKDRVINTTILIAGALNVFLALLLAPRFRHCGMAWAVVITESFVALMLVVYLKRNRLLPPTPE
jgi:polysaccharide transporter, PST family